MEQTSTYTTHIEEKKIFQYALNHAFEDGYGIALWKLPHDKSRNAIISFTPGMVAVDQMLEDLHPGFMFAPFDKNAPRYYLKGDVMFSYKEGKLQASEQSSDWIAGAAEQIGKLQGESRYHVRSQVNYASMEQEEFCAMVEEAVAMIEKNEFEKVVPSRARKIDLPADFDTIEAFQRLCERYPEAMVSLVSIPGAGTWIGATPELLVDVNNQSTFKTVALAGTRPFTEGTDPREVAWTQKEIEEQALVSRYIINCFKMIRLREFEEHGPKSVVAGNLMHLRTEYSVDMNATNFPQLGSVMLQLLHPTSAVCGMPTEKTMEFIRQHEKHDRLFYSGFVGPVNVNQNIDLYVNLRCMNLLGGEAVCYAGAGVTIDSIPAKEWEETEMKMNTLLSVIL